MDKTLCAQTPGYKRSGDFMKQQSKRRAGLLFFFGFFCHETNHVARSMLFIFRYRFDRCGSEVSLAGDSGGRKANHGGATCLL